MGRLTNFRPAGRTRRRAMITAVAFGLVLLLGFTGFVLRLAENAIRSGAEAEVRSTAQLSARLVDEQSLRFGEVVSAYALRLNDLPIPRHSRLPPAASVRLSVALSALVGNVDGIRAAAFTDPEGRLVARVPQGGVPGSDFSRRDWFRGALKQSPYQSRALIAADANVKVTVEAVTVRNTDGRLIGVLTASESHRAQKLADTYGRQLGATVTITDQSGQIVGRTGNHSEKLVSIAGDPLVHAALAGHHGVLVRTIDGRRTVSGYAPVPGTGWTVLAERPASKAFADVPRLRVTLLIGAGVVALLLVGLIPLLVSRLGSARDALDVSEEFQRDLLPPSLPAGVRSHYVPSERRMLLGGDFLDVVEMPDGGIAVLIGDVCGHGPRAAALAATVRAGWRTMATAGSPLERIALLDQLVESARRNEDLFATIACAVLAPDGRSLRYAVAGHPPPLLIEGGSLTWLEATRGPALGLGAPPDWPVNERVLAEDWSLVLYTDGLIEARPNPGRPRLGFEGLEKLVSGAIRDGRLDGDQLMKVLAAGAKHPDDDVALLLVDSSALGAGVGAAAKS